MNGRISTAPKAQFKPILENKFSKIILRSKHLLHTEQMNVSAGNC